MNMADFSSLEDDSKREAWRANLSVLSTAIQISRPFQHFFDVFDHHSFDGLPIVFALFCKSSEEGSEL